MRPAAVLLAALVLLAACGPVRQAPPTAGTAPSRVPAPEPARGAWQIVPEGTELLILVYRDGPLAAVGHNHVIASRALAGQVVPGDREGDGGVRFELTLPVASFTVDEPALRAGAGPDFADPVEASAIAGTRANMLGASLLDAASFPDIRILGRQAGGTAPDYTLDVQVTVRDQVRAFTVPARVTVEGGVLTAEGSFPLRQSELGLTPFSVMGGLLRVRDGMEVRYRLRAEQR